MITNFGGVSRKFIITNKVKVILSSLSVAVAIGFIVSIFSIANSMEYSYKQECKSVYGDMDLMVGFDSNTGKYLNDTQINKIIKSNGIENASSLLVIPGTVISNVKDVSKLSPSVYTLGAESNSLTKSRYKYNKDIEKNEVVITNDLAATLNVKVNDEIKVMIPDNSFVKCKVSEIISGPKGVVVPDVAIFNINSLRTWFKLDNKATFMLLKTNSTVDKYKIATILKDIDEKLRVDIIGESEDIQRNVKQIKVIGYILGIMAVAISALFILSNLQLFMYEYQHEIAIMRAIGGNASQSFRIVINQAIVIVLSGTILGGYMAFQVSKLLPKVFEFLFGIRNIQLSFKWAYAIGICILSSFSIMTFVLLPAIKSFKVLPIQAMRKSEKLDYRKSNISQRFFIGSIVVGVALLIISYITRKGMNSGVVSLLGGLLIVVGIFLIFAYNVGDILILLLPVWKFFGGSVAFISIKNLIPRIRQNTLIILSLAGAITVAITGCGILETVKVNSTKIINEEYISDIVLSSRYDLNSKINYDFSKKVEEIRGVKDAIVISKGDGKDIISIKGNVNSDKSNRFDYILADLDKLSKEGWLPELNGDISNIAVFSKDYAEKLKLKIGDEIRVRPSNLYIDKIDNYKGKQVSIKVAAIVERLPGITTTNWCMIDWSNKDLQDSDTILDRIMINVDKTKMNEVLIGLNDLKAQYPEIKWSSLKEALLESNQMIAQRYALLGAAVLVILFASILGSVLTLSSHIHAQRREYAILRAISITPGQLFKIVLSQGLLYSIVGSVIGIIAGIIMICSLSISFDERSVLNWRLILYIISGIIGSSLILTIPLAKRISEKSVTEELISTTRF